MTKGLTIGFNVWITRSNEIEQLSLTMTFEQQFKYSYCMCIPVCVVLYSDIYLYYLLTYLLHGAESFLRS